MLRKIKKIKRNVRCANTTDRILQIGPWDLATLSAMGDVFGALCCARHMAYRCGTVRSVKSGTCIILKHFDVCKWPANSNNSNRIETTIYVIVCTHFLDVNMHHGQFYIPVSLATIRSFIWLASFHKQSMHTSICYVPFVCVFCV